MKKIYLVLRLKRLQMNDDEPGVQVQFDEGGREFTSMDAAEEYVRSKTSEDYEDYVIMPVFRHR
jgi:hypothetical protein